MLHFQSRTNDSPPNDLYAPPTKDPLSPPRSPYLSSPVPKFDNSPRPSSIASSTLDDILLPGDFVTEGGYLQGELIRRVSLTDSPRPSLDESACDPKPVKEFQVVRRLGTGSYAVVYLVQEVLSRSPSSTGSDESGVLGSMDLDSSSSHSRHSSNSISYGRQYAIKCLSKANLDEEQLSAQMTEVKIHQSLPSHPNIVTLHRTLESSSFLLLLLEFVPGEDLFYFLEQARDHFDSSSPTEESVVASATPPTPSLLSTLHPSQLLSRTRLRLVASMFQQMCEAVATAHGRGVYHRDIKPENFIVTDGSIIRSDGSRERKVFVKLTDFGLSTTDRESSDMDCGSAPYMSYECRNNVAPSYRTDAADVWSLGIVLINMLYHHNPWTDTAQGACSSFDLFRSNPGQFFMQRFAGMVPAVAEFLAAKVFCILEDGAGPTGASRITAHEFGIWVQSLPDLLAAPPVDHRSTVNKRHQRVISTASSIDHPVSSLSQVSHRPCSRNPSGSTSVTRTPALRSRSLSRAPSGIGATYERQDLSELSTVIDQSQEHLPIDEDEDTKGQEIELPESFSRDESPSPSRSASANKRRKRGRKGKGASSTSIATPTTPADETLDMLAKASQTLAREISKQSKPASVRSARSATSGRSTRSMEPPAMFGVPMAMVSSNPMAPPPLPLLATSTAVSDGLRPPAVPTKKPSKWKLSIGKNKGASVVSSPLATEEPSQASPASPTTPPAGFAVKSTDPQLGTTMSVTASNVTSLLMGLNAPPSATATKNVVNDGQWPRGRRNRGSPGPPSSGVASRSPGGSQSRSRGRRGGASPYDIHDIPVPPIPSHVLSPASSDNWSAFDRERGRSPNSMRSSKAPSVSSSTASSNWRSSTMSSASSAVTSSSAFTRYSNSSSRSVSTAATSVSGHSWRNKDNASVNSGHSGNSSRYHQAYPNVPRNIKIMTGVPNELVKLPRGPSDRDPHGPPRKQRSRKPKDISLDSPLGTINERPAHLSPEARSSGARSPASARDESSSSPLEMAGDGKAQKGQINTLAKMLSALRR